ncbi:DUF4407 domain-containing protein [Microbacterium sp. 1P10AE]|uniref:DUF4407 domain-containing protein n=1 Tax=Microbacterium sp. 1P10AE TaxID=3132286 RepID=UPI0039A2CA85
MAILGGADPRVLERAPSEAGRFVTMFLVLLGTALLSGISICVALITAMEVWWWVAAPLALIWMALIFNLDRFLTSSIKSTRNVSVLVIAALPRVAMAAVIGVIVAEPLVLQLFNDEITREMNAINQVEETTQLQALETGILAKARDDTRQRYLDLAEQERTGVIAGTGDSETYSVSEARAQVARLTDQLAQASTDLQSARALYQCELNGGNVAGCSGTPGDGTNARSAQQQIDEANQRWSSLSQQLQSAEAALSEAEAASAGANESSEAANRQQAATQVEAARLAEEQALAAYDAERTRIQTDVANSTGLIARMNALETLTFGDRMVDAQGNVLRETEGSPIIGWAHFALATLFFMFEILPVVSKSVMAYGDKSLYEQVEAMDKASMVEREKIERNDSRWEAQQRSGNRRKQIEHMLELEADQARKANVHVAREMEKVLDLALATWSSHLPHADPRQDGPPPRPTTHDAAHP